MTLAWFFRAHHETSAISFVALGLIVGGALGNLIDRIFRGPVVDYIEIWFWPVFNVADLAIVAGVIMMIIFTLLLSPIFSYIRIKAKSVIAAAIIHGSLNATVGLAIMPIRGGDDLTVGVTGLSGFIVLTIINIIIYKHMTR